MAAHKKSLTLVLLLCSFVVSGFSLREASARLAVAGAEAVSRTANVRLKADTTQAQASVQAPPAPQHIVSLIPSVTEMLFAMGAGPRVIGVGNFDRYPPEALTRTKVGGLIDPDVERIISLKPDLVVVYGTQAELRMQLQRANIPLFLYEHSGLADVTTTIRALGRRVGSVQSGEALAASIEASIADTRRRVAGKPRPRTLLVFGRDAETLRGMYASGGIGFLHDLLDAAGGANVLSDVNAQSMQISSELVLARAPEVILEIGIDTASSKARNLAAWDALAAVPAVRTRRIYQIRGDEMMNPGPRVVQALRRMSEALHPVN